MRVIGTAGHVDHGKSTLVKALTGINPDRLREEQIREMTIDLGFAWFTLPDGEEVGIIDVPGHRDFIENMLAGVGGIDAALFVIAADEGVMPQTREHLAILDILQIQGGVVVLTKVDMVDDAEWLEMVEEETRGVLSGTVLQDAPILRVSARKGTGLAELKTALADCLSQRPSRPDLGRPRLPIDRAFSIAGFGTIVTGTLTDGLFKAGDEVEILPSGLHTRIRGLQSHKQKEETAQPGTRIAVNLSGVDLEQVQRGNILARPGAYRSTQRIDVNFRLLKDASAPIHHNTEVKLFIGTSEVVARLRLLGTETLEPGEEGWLQLELQEPVVCVRGDRYILRRPSPGETLGGGLIVEPFPSERHKRFSTKVIQQLESLSQGSPDEILYLAFSTLGPVPLSSASSRARLSPEQSTLALRQLIEQKLVVGIEPGQPALQNDLLIITQPQFALETQKALDEIKKYHSMHPLRRGMPREELKSRLKLSGRIFNDLFRLWNERSQVVENHSQVALPSHSIHISSTQQALVKTLLNRFAKSPYAPPIVKECQMELGEELYNALLELNELFEVSSDVVFRKSDYEVMLLEVKNMFTRQPTLTLAEVRDRFNTSRRYIQAFMEHLDAIGLTIREGDARKLK